MKYLYLFLLAAILLSCKDKTSRLKELLDQGLAAEDRNDYETAISSYMGMLDINPKDYAAANSIAGLYGKEEQFADEIIWAQKSIDINPWFALSHINLGNGYLGQGDLDKAAACYKKAEKNSA